MAKKCYAIGGRINFNRDDVSLCHGIDIGDCVIWKYGCGEDFTPEYYNKKIKELNEINNSKHARCQGCSNLIENGKTPNKIEIVTINPMYYCQNRCIYCGNFRGQRESLYDPLPMIEDFIREGMIADNCLFDWGGGEPTVSDDFDRIFLYLLEHDYMQRVNTNAIYISDVVFNNLDNDKVSLRISLDSGNAEAFLATKGRNLFDQVVNNIKLYREKTDNILLKYVITNSNSDEKSITDFVNLAKDLDIKAICIDTDMLSYGWDEYPDLLRFTEKELNAARSLQRLAHEKQINVQIGYVWTARNPMVPSRDFNSIQSIKELIQNNENYKLPDGLSEFHLNRISEFSNGIVPTVLASFETLFYSLKGKKIVLYGAGNNGRRLLRVLKDFDFDVLCFCDKKKYGTIVDGVEVKTVEEVMGFLDDNIVVIITPYIVKDILRDFNTSNYSKLKGHLYYIDEFRYSDQVLEEMR